jgi:hypothetical protein
MSEKDDRCEVCKMPRSDHKVFSHQCPKGHWDFAETTFVEPVHIHECDHETEGEHVCRCVICGKHIGTPPSEGTTPLEPSASLLVKLGSIAVHAEEILSPNRHQFDLSALQTLLDDAEVKEWLKKNGQNGVSSGEAMSEGATPQAERPDYRDMACKYCHRLRVQQSGICEKCQWDNDLGNFASITGRCPNSSDGKHEPVSGNNIMGGPFTECELCKIELPQARAVAPVETPKAAKLMVTRGGEIHEECPDCRGECSPYKPAVQTRLTAEPFWQTWIDTPLFEELSAKYSPDEWSKIACAFGEAFRDKSEAAVRAEISREYQQELFHVEGALEKSQTVNAELREEIERLNKELEKLK